jgi:proline iminopeptidase
VSRKPHDDIPLHGNGEYIDTRYGRLYYEAEGEGPPLVLVAGGPGGSHVSFHPWFSRLSDRFRVVYFDNIGRGRSDRLADPRGYTVERDAEDIEALRRTLGFDRFSLLGHSYGGMPALAYACAHPGRLTGLVLSDTLHSANGFQQNIDSCNALVRNQYPEVWARLMALRRSGVKSTADEYTDLYGAAYGDLYWYNLENQDKMNRSGDSADRFNNDVYLALVGDDPEWRVTGAMRAFDPRPRLDAMTAPTLVCVGRYDRVATPKVARELVRALPRESARLVVFERSGHRPWVEETDRYFDVVSAFLRGEPIPDPTTDTE